MTRPAIERKAAFDRIRYAQCWEDADILLEALQVREGDVCLSIASAGDNTLALLACNPARVIAIDLSIGQLHCLALRVAAYRRLDYAALLELIGSRPSTRRAELLRHCIADLEPEAAAFWRERADQVVAVGVGGVGKFEGYLRFFRRVVLPLVCGRRGLERLFEPRSDRAEREVIFARRWDSARWRAIARTFFSRAVVGRFARDPAFFDYVEGSLSEHVVRRVRHTFVELEPARNPYLQWILLGAHRTALPFALRAENVPRIRANLDRLELRRRSLEAFVAGGERADAFNLSDVFEYTSDRDFRSLYAALLDASNPDARFAYWNMMVPRSCPPEFARRVRPDEGASRLYDRDRAIFYRRFVVEHVRPW